MSAVSTAAPNVAKDVPLVVCDVGGQRLALHAESVREVVRMVALTALPGTPAWCAGALNLRGDIVPVVDLRARLGVGEPHHGLSTPIVIATRDASYVGLIADAVVDLATGHVMPQTETRFGSEFVDSVASLDGSLIPVLDVTRICAGLDDVLGSTR